MAKYDKIELKPSLDKYDKIELKPSLAKYDKIELKPSLAKYDKNRVKTVISTGGSRVLQNKGGGKCQKWWGTGIHENIL